MLEYLLSAEFYQVMLFYVFSGVLLGAALLVVTMLLFTFQKFPPHQ